MKYIQYVVAVVLVGAFTGIAVYDANQQTKSDQQRKNYIQQTMSKVQKLQVEHFNLTNEISELEKENNKNIDKVKELENQKLEFEEEIDKLNKELQAKREEKKRVASISLIQKASAETSNGFVTNKKALMRQVGIPESDFWAVDYILSKESSWRYNVWNTEGSGAYGLCQSLPANKMATAGADYLDNPVTQLKWCNTYAHDRYGSWSNAYTFWVNNQWW